MSAESGHPADALRRLADEIPGLIAKGPGSAEHVQWAARCERILRKLAGKDSVYYRTFTTTRWGDIAGRVFGGPEDPWASMNVGAAMERERHRVFQKQLDGTKGLLLAAAEEVDEGGAGTADAAAMASAPSTVIRVLNLVERQLRKVIRTEPKREREVQDAFESLLHGAEIHHEREKESISYSSKTYTPDFTFTEADLVVELKLCLPGREKELIEQINDDILAYKTKHRNLIFAVYDVGSIRDVDLFIGSFEKHSDVIVRVVKH